MLVVKVEIWPLGRENNKETLGTAVIANDGGLASDAYADYTVYAADGDIHADALTDSLVYERWARLYNHQRRLGFWKLIARALEKVGGDDAKVSR